MEDSDWSLSKDIRIICGSGPKADWGSAQAAEQIKLELYFHRNDPRKNLEFFCFRENGGDPLNHRQNDDGSPSLLTYSTRRYL